MTLPRCVFFVWLVVSLSVPAEGQVGHAEASGTVTDGTGAVLPGVSVTAIHSATGAVRTTLTDGSGIYRFNNLTVGTYQFRARLSGFGLVLVENYRLNIGQSAILDFQMRVAGVDEAMTVRAPLVQTTKSELSGNVTDIQVAELPVLGRNWLGFALLAPGVKSDGAEGAEEAPPTAGIGVGRQDRVVLDGMDLNNRSMASEIDVMLSKEVIGEFEVKTNQFDAQMGQSGTSIVQAISRSGSDNLAGNVYYFFRDESLNAEDFFTGGRQPFRNEQYGGTIGGPIALNTTHFFFNYERQKEPKTVSANTGIAAFDRPVDGSDERNLWFLRLDHALTRNHRASVRVNRYTRLQPHAGTGGSTPPVNSIDFDWTVNRYNAALNSVIADKWANQFTFNYMNTDRFFNKRPNSGPLHMFPSVSLGGNMEGGFEDPDFWAIRNDVSSFFTWNGQHNLKFGGYAERAYLTGRFLFGVNGVYSYTRDPANLATCCASENQSDWDTSQFPIPTQYAALLGDPSTHAPNDIVSGYIQDDWTVHPRLTVNAGVRYDVEFGSLLHDLDGALLQEPFANDIDNFQPRLGFAYALTSDRRTMLRAGAGRFVTQAFLNITFFVERMNRVRQINATLTNPTGDPGFAADPLGGMTFEDLKARVGNPDFPIDIAIYPPGTEQPSSWSYSSGVAHQLADDMSVSVDYVYQRSDDMLRSVDTNLFCCRPDGNALPVVSGVFPELGGLVEGYGRPDQRFNTIRSFTNAGRARYHGLQVAFEKRFSHDFQGGATYLLSRNKDNFTDVFDYPSNNFNLAEEYSDSTHDQRHRFTANWVARLPYEFTFSGLVFAGSGRAVPVSVGGIDLFATAPDPRGRSARPTCGWNARFDPGCAALRIPEGIRVPRNAFRSDSVFRMDMRVARIFRAGQTASIEPSFEMFNVFNRENHDPRSFNTNLGSTQFGSPGRSSSLPYLPRQIQLGVRLVF